LSTKLHRLSRDRHSSWELPLRPLLWPSRQAALTRLALFLRVAQARVVAGVGFLGLTPEVLAFPSPILDALGGRTKSRRLSAVAKSLRLSLGYTTDCGCPATLRPFQRGVSHRYAQRCGAQHSAILRCCFVPRSSDPRHGVGFLEPTKLRPLPYLWSFTPGTLRPLACC
jgi:hypothetical protein